LRVRFFVYLLSAVARELLFTFYQLLRVRFCLPFVSCCACAFVQVT
jgi:hypothetical protein